MANGEWVWDVDLEALVGCHAHLETTDGIIRQGRISAIKSKTFKLAGEDLTIPEAVELNGDPMDEVPFDRLLKLDLVSKADPDP